MRQFSLKINQMVAAHCWPFSLNTNTWACFLPVLTVIQVYLRRLRLPDGAVPVCMNIEANSEISWLLYAPYECLYLPSVRFSGWTSEYVVLQIPAVRQNAKMVYNLFPLMSISKFSWHSSRLQLLSFGAYAGKFIKVTAIFPWERNHVIFVVHQNVCRIQLTEKHAYMEFIEMKFILWWKHWKEPDSGSNKQPPSMTLLPSS